MKTIKETKENLKRFLESSFELLATENLPLATSIRTIGVGTALLNLTKSPSFKNLNILGHVILLKSKNQKMIQKIKDENIKAFVACLNIESEITYQDVMRSFYEKEKNKDLITIKKLDDLKHNLYKYKHEKFENEYDLFEFHENSYINPYTETKVTIKNEIKGAYITKKTNIDERYNESIINLPLIDQLLTLDSITENQEIFDILEKTFGIKKFTKMETEFTLFHELAHTGLIKFNLDDNSSEINSDICGALNVIKNNNLNKYESIIFIDYLIYWRSNKGPLIHYSNVSIDDNGKIIENKRIHSTQFGLLILKDFVNKDFDYIKSLTLEEELILASHASLISNSKLTMETFIKRQFDEIKLFEEIMVDKWLENEKINKCIENIASNQNLKQEEIKDIIKYNVRGKPEAIFDLMTSYMAFDNLEELKNLKSYSLFALEIIKSRIEKANETKLPLTIKRNFSKTDLFDEIAKEKNKKSPKP